MVGSTFIAAKDPSNLSQIDSPDALDDFDHIDLERMTTLDFAEVLTAKKIKWTDGEPVLFDEANGAALFKISEKGLTYTLDHVAAFPEELHADLKLLSAFVRKHGPSAIYEYATF